MAMEINYCDKCGLKIAATEFSSGIPVRHGELTYCEKCAVKAGIEVPPAPLPPKKTPMQNRVIERVHRHEHSSTNPQVSMRTVAMRNTQRMVLLLVLACVAGIGITVYLLNIKVENSITMSKMTPRASPKSLNTELRKELQANAQEGLLEVKALGAWDRADALFKAEQWQQALAEFQTFKNDYAGTAFFTKQAPLLNRRLAAIHSVMQPVFEMPKEWKGATAGSSDNNPLLIENVGRWRLDRIWPDDPAKFENFKAMVWNGKHWQAPDNVHGNQPEAWVSNGTLTLASRTEWPDSPGAKLSALIFIAPRKTNYTLTASVKPEIFDDGAPLQLKVMKRIIRDGRVDNVALIDLKDKSSLKLALEPVALDENEELILLPVFGHGRCAAKFVFDKLKIVSDSETKVAQ